MSVNNSLYCDPVHRYARPEQRAEWLAPYASGEKLGAFALTGDPRLKTANFGKADSSGLAVGECGSETHKKAGKAGTKVYPIDANTTAQLQAYFAPHNAMLYKLLGRDLGWGPKRGT